MSDEIQVIPVEDVKRVIGDCIALAGVAMYHANGDPTTAIAKLEGQRGLQHVAAATGWEADVIELAQQGLRVAAETVEAP